jgi:hypothetical protein
MADEKAPEGVPGQISEGEFVHPRDGQEHGYYGTLPHTEDPEAHTVAGVTGGTANVADEPKSAQTSTKRTASRSAAKPAD